MTLQAILLTRVIPLLFGAVGIWVLMATVRYVWTATKSPTE